MYEQRAVGKFVLKGPSVAVTTSIYSLPNLSALIVEIADQSLLKWLSARSYGAPSCNISCDLQHRKRNKVSSKANMSDVASFWM